jgi:transposase
MPQNFLECDREQVFLMPPDPRDWLPEGHVAWFVLASVEEMDLSVFYGSYRADGWGRAAFEPSMMVSLLLYSYAMGERSSRGIERKCVEDVAYRVIAAQQKPDHATIARFRVRHENALAELFGSVLLLCREAGLVKVGVVAIDGTKMHANASHHSNVDYEQLAREILKEAGEIDAAEDELYGEGRGDELPEHLRTREGRRAALAEAKQKLARERGKNVSAQGEAAGEVEVAEVKIELDPDVIVARTQGREGWLREARHQLDEHRRREARPIVRSRAQRLLEAERRMVQDLEVERAANEEYEHYRSHGRDTQGRRLSRPPTPYESPDIPAGKINTTDLDSRNVKTPRSYTQGYNVQAVVTEEQIVLAAEVSASSPDFGHLAPMVKATKRELQAIGVTETPGVAVADSGYWNEQQMDHVVANEHVQVLIPPDAGKRQNPRPGWQGGEVHGNAPGTRERLRRPALPATQGNGRAGVRTDQAQPAHQPVPATRTIGRALRMAANYRHPQSSQAPQAPNSRRSGLTGRLSAAHAPQRPRGHDSQAQRSPPRTAPTPTRREPLHDTHRPFRSSAWPALARSVWPRSISAQRESGA